jgi:hypothetical protein
MSLKRPPFRSSLTFGKGEKSLLCQMWPVEGMVDPTDSEARNCLSASDLTRRHATAASCCFELLVSNTAHARVQTFRYSEITLQSRAA